MTESPRVLIVSQHYWPENFRSTDMAEYFVSQGVSVDVLCGLPNYPTGLVAPGYSWRKNRRQTHHGVRIFRSLEIPRTGNSGLRIFLNYISFPVLAFTQLPALLRRRHDAVLVYQTSPVMMALPALVLGRLKRVPTTTYVLDMWPENLFSVLPVANPLARSLATRHSHWYYRHSPRLIALSERMRSRLQQVTGKSPEAITVVPQTSEKLYEERVSDPELADRFDGKFTVVFTGNISPAQSFETMIEAAQLLKEQGYKDVTWLIVGDGMSRATVEAQVAAAGLSDVFVFEGSRPVDDMPKYGGIADVLVACLAKSELLEATIPAKVTSYLAMGKPIALAMDGEVRELVNEAAQCGFAGPAGDAAALAANIARLHDATPAARAAMGQRGFEYYSANMERSVVLDRVLEFILEP